MNLKSIAALGFVAAMTAFGTAPASANASTSSVERAAQLGDQLLLHLRLCPLLPRLSRAGGPLLSRLPRPLLHLTNATYLR